MRRLLRLPELVELTTRPEVIDHMLAELGPAMTIAVLRVLRAKAEAWHPDEPDLSDLPPQSE
jgi:hypothetical protein